MWGLFKKVVVADNLALIVTPVLRPASCQLPPGAIASSGPWPSRSRSTATSRATPTSPGGVAASGLQAAWTTSAQPYFATSIAEFWRRWHITLSTWLRDYLYVPLGGNRTARPRPTGT